MKKLLAMIRLTRFKEFTFFVIVTTFLGIAAGHGQLSWTLIGVLAANWLSVMFAFMINDVEDAPDDALNPKKIKRNPVSAGELSPEAAKNASLGVAILAVILYALLGLWPFLLGFCSLALGFVYSWRKIRVKNIAFLDLASHCLMLAGLQFLTGFIAFDRHQPTLQWLIPLIFVVAISLYGELFNELRDLEGDLKAGLRHTAVVLGSRLTYWIMMSLLAIGSACGFGTFFVLSIIPTWVILVLAAALAVFIAVPAYRIRRHRTALALQESFQKPLEMSGALALGVQFAGPWAWSVISSLARYVILFR